MSVRLQVCGFNFEREVDIVSSERVARIDRPTRKLLVVEDFESYADGDALVRKGGPYGLSAGPQQHRVVPGVTLYLRSIIGNGVLGRSNLH